MLKTGNSEKSSRLVHCTGIALCHVIEVLTFSLQVDI